MAKLVYGVGKNDTDYVIQSRIDGRYHTCPFYVKWRDMLKRCYSEQSLKTRPSYIGCSVTSEWHSFMNFKSWMETQDWEGKHLDKDLLVRGNKVYGPDTCTFVTQATNNFTTDRSAARGNLPIGVQLVQLKTTGLPYRADVRANGKPMYLGCFSTPEEAHQAWRVAKWELAVQLASEQSDPRVAAALIERYKL